MTAIKKQNTISKNSQEWLIISDYLEQRLQELREKNDNPLTELETAQLRGSVREIKLILKLPQKMPPAKYEKCESEEYLN